MRLKVLERREPPGRGAAPSYLDFARSGRSSGRLYLGGFASSIISRTLLSTVILLPFVLMGAVNASGEFLDWPAGTSMGAASLIGSHRLVSGVMATGSPQTVCSRPRTGERKTDPNRCRPSCGSRPLRPEVDPRCGQSAMEQRDVFRRVRAQAPSDETFDTEVDPITGEIWYPKATWEALVTRRTQSRNPLLTGQRSRHCSRDRLGDIHLQEIVDGEIALPQTRPPTLAQDRRKQNALV